MTSLVLDLLMLTEYQPDDDSSLWCPVKSKADMSKLPPAYIQVDGMVSRSPTTVVDQV